MAAEPIFGFRDSNAWERKGNRIVARARNTSYLEKLRSGIPIEYFFDLDDFSSTSKKTMTKRIRPDFMEPLPWLKYISKVSIPSLHSHGYSENDMFEDTEEPAITRNHRGSARSMKRRGKTPKYEPKVQKQPARLNRGKVRVDAVDYDYYSHETSWVDECDRVIDSQIWWELRHPTSNSYGCKYTYKDYDSIIRRFKAQLDPVLHPTSTHIRAVWNTNKATILSDYTPLQLIIPEYRHFDGFSYTEVWDDDFEDDMDLMDWIHNNPLHIYW